MHRYNFSTFILLLSVLMAVTSGDTQAQTPGAGDDSLQQDIASLKTEVLRLNRELSALENELLFPADSGFFVFFSLDTADGFELDSLELMQNGRVIAGHLYTPGEIRALRNGGIQPLYQGNLAPGQHQMEARLIGRHASGTAFRQLKPVKLKKTARTLYLELRLSGAEKPDKPALQVNAWD